MAREKVGPNGANALLSVADVDLAYVEQAKAGNTKAFRPLWEKYERALYQFFVKRVNDRQEAEDLASETLLAALQAIPHFRGSSLDSDRGAPAKHCTFRTYLSAIARYKLAKWIRRKRVRREVRLEDLAVSPQGEAEVDWAETMLGSFNGSASNPLDTVLEADRQETVCYALASLQSDAQFKAMLLHYFAGLSHQEVAAALVTRGETVNSRLQDGRKALRRSFERLNGAVSEA